MTLHPKGFDPFLDRIRRCWSGWQPAGALPP